MSSFQRPEDSQSASELEDADALQWQAAVARARHRTYEGPPASQDASAHNLNPTDAMATHEPAFVHDGEGHAWRGPEAALRAEPQGPRSRWPTAILSGVLVATAAAALVFVGKQGYDRRLEAKDRLLNRVEAQKATAYDQRDKALSELADLRAEMSGQIATLRAERNAAINAAAPQNDAPRAAVAKPTELPKMPTKIAIPDDPLLGLGEGQGDLKRKPKVRKR